MGAEVYPPGGTPKKLSLDKSRAHGAASKDYPRVEQAPRAIQPKDAAEAGIQITRVGRYYAGGP
ncbi:MAG: hypothetical protein ABIP64_16345 [Burkholderiales bacterium]